MEILEENLVPKLALKKEEAMNIISRLFRLASKTAARHKALHLIKLKLRKSYAHPNSKEILCTQNFATVD
jgi:hypothetical protein